MLIDLLSFYTNEIDWYLKLNEDWLTDFLIVSEYWLICWMSFDWLVFEQRMQKRELCGMILKEKEQARIAAQQKYVDQSHLNSLNPPPPPPPHGSSVRSHLVATQANNA